MRQPTYRARRQMLLGSRPAVHKRIDEVGRVAGRVVRQRKGDPFELLEVCPRIGGQRVAWRGP